MLCNPTLEARAVDALLRSRSPSPLSRATGVRAVPMAMTFLLSASVLTLPSVARDLQISFSPDAPTWRDAVVMTVSGPAPFCTAELGEPEITFAGHWHIDLDLVDLCTIGPPAVDGSFSVSTTLHPLTPREAPVTVHDLADGGDTSTEMLTIHPGADLEVAAVEPASSAQPLRFQIEGVGACPGAVVTRPSPFVVRAEFDANCPILPPGEERFTLELEAGPLAPGDYEIQVIDHRSNSGILPAVTTRARVWDATRCVPSGESHCLERGRFRVSSSFRDFESRTGVGRTLPTSLEDTGLFWFFSPDNVELTIKVLDGCSVNGRFWVFVSSGSTVEYEVEVTDTQTGQRRIYDNDLGELPELIADTSAFTACPERPSL